MVIMANNNNLAAVSAEPDQVEASHSLDDSENSHALQNDMFFDADLDRLFDEDDEVAGGALGSGGIEYDSGMMVVEGQQQETQSEIKQQNERSQPDQQISNAKGIPSTITTQSSTTNVLAKPKLKRRNSNLEGENRGLPPPGWHSEAADRQHRQEMILEIARLLQARKKEVPSEAWLRELPHKARKLEGRLYKTAPSLEAYLDRRTLKARLKRLARALVRHFGDSKRSSFRSTRSSMSSTPTIPTRDSIHSTDSSRSLQPARPSRSLISSSRKSQSWSEGRKSRTEIPEDSVAETPAAQVPEPTANGAVADQARETAPGPSSRRSSSMGTKSGTGRAGAPSPSVSQEQMQQLMFEQEQQLLMKSELSRQSLKQNNLMSSSALQASSDSGMAIQSTMSSSLPTNGRMEMGNLNVNMTDLERQKAVNERLQQQIAENVRRQQELVRQLQGQGSSQEASTLSRQHQNSSAIGDMARNGFGSSMQGAMEPNAVQFNNHPSNNLNMMGMPTAVPPNPGMTPQTLNFLMNQQHRQQQSHNNSNPSQMQQQQHLFNFQQASNLNHILGFQSNANMLTQAFGSQPQGAQNVLMQQSQMMHGLFHQPLPGGNSSNSNPDAQLHVIGGNRSSLSGQQQMPLSSSLQALQRQQQEQQHNSSAESRRTSYSSSTTGQGSNHGSARNSSHNNNIGQPQNRMELSQQPGNLGNNATGGQVGNEESTNLDALNNDGDNDSPLSPTSFRW